MSLEITESNDLTVEYHGSDEQTLLVVDGDRVAGVFAIESDVDSDEALELVDTIEAEVGHLVPGLRVSRETAVNVYKGP